MERSLKFEGAKLFNAMPAYLRNMTSSKDKFKNNLDKLLNVITDQLGTRGLVPHALTELCQPTNSLKYWIKTLSLQHWVPSANERLSLPDNWDHMTAADTDSTSGRI